MIRTCNGSDPNLKTADGQVGNCGRTFDDINHWTTCPHDEFPINPGVAAVLRAGGVDAQSSFVDRGAGRPYDGPAIALPGEPVNQQGGRVGGLPGWTQNADDGLWYPPTRTIGEVAEQRDQGDGEENPDSDEARITAAGQQYSAALHAMQTGIAYMAHRSPSLYEPKHMRVGVNSAKVEQGALASLLISKGVFTEVEYYEAMAAAAQREVALYEEQLSQQYYGRTIKLA